MGKAIIRGITKMFDISGSTSSQRIYRIYNKNIINGFSTDKKNITSDFNNSIKKLTHG